MEINILDRPKTKPTPYACHLFVCLNDRKGQRKSCADGNSPETLERLTQAIKVRGLQKKVGISQSGCMALCKHGPNIVAYPQKIWFAGVCPDDVEEILDKVEELLAEAV